jgi:beta-lactamase class D
MPRRAVLLATALALLPLSGASARTLCTLVADASDLRTLIEQGDCGTRVTPASTFKIALAVMGFDAGVLPDPHHPLLTQRSGDPDWGGEAWRRPTDPVRWLKYSVVWYSQRVTHALGAARLGDYARQWGYGNADMSGDPGKGNGLDRAWLASSLKISPREQVVFLGRLVNHTLPVDASVYGKVDAVVESLDAGGWTVHGKTGMAYPRRSDGGFDEAHAYGWFVGWAGKEERRIVFARLIQDDAVTSGPAGNRARAAFLAELPQLMAAARP